MPGTATPPAPDLAAIAASAVRAVIGVHHGTGTALTADVVVTTAHVLRGRGHGDPIDLHLPDGRRIDGTVLARADDHDLATVRGQGLDLQPLPFAPASPAVGDAVAALAAPGGTPRITAGTVAAVGTRLRTAAGSPVDGLLEHTAPVPRGASGGPVLTIDGSLAAVALNRLDGGLYQALPLSDAVRSLLDLMVAGETPPSRRLGITVTPPRAGRRLREAVGLDPMDGVLVASVADDGPAADAGLGRGDLITAVDGTATPTPEDLLLALRAGQGPVTLTVVRGAGPERAVTLTPA